MTILRSATKWTRGVFSQLVCGMTVFLLSPVALMADNCGSTSDCYGTAQAAVTVISALLLATVIAGVFGLLFVEAAGAAALEAAGATLEEAFASEAAELAEAERLAARLARDKALYGQAFEWTEAQTLEEQIALDQAKNGAGTVEMNGPFNDPKYQGPDWVKMEYKTVTSDGNKIQIHYMRDTITGETDQFKFLSRGEYPKPRK